MLSIFKARARATSLSSSSESTKEDQPATSKKNSEGKDEKVSRFSFKRRKSVDKKKKARRDSDTSSSLNVSDPLVACVSDKLNQNVENTESNYNDDSLAYCSSFSDIADNSLSSSIASIVPDSISEDQKFENGIVTNNIDSHKPKIDLPTYQRKVPVFQQPDLHMISSVSSPKTIRTYVYSTDNSQNSIDGNLSMLSTPSSSTSSLSSISNRPISPSGRRTPPGPKLGTTVRIGSSPTPTRRTSRTHIKTNPNASSRKTGTVLPLNENFEEDVNHTESSRNNSLTISQNTQDLKLPYEGNTTPPNSPSPSSGKLPRQSVTSLQSLESIPEHDSDNAFDYKVMKLPKKPFPKIDINLANKGITKCKIIKPDSTNPVDIKTNPSKNQCSFKNNNRNPNVAKSEERRDKNIISFETNKMIVTNKPPLSRTNEFQLSEDGAAVIQGLRISPLKEIKATVNDNEPIVVENNDISPNRSSSHNTEEPTHFVLNFSHPNWKRQDFLHKTTSLEDIPKNLWRRSLSPNKFSVFKGDKFKDDVFPKSSSPGLNQRERSRSLSRMDLLTSQSNEVQLKFGIPISIKKDSKNYKENEKQLVGNGSIPSDSVNGSDENRKDNKKVNDLYMAAKSQNKSDSPLNETKNRCQSVKKSAESRISDNNKQTRSNSSSLKRSGITDRKVVNQSNQLENTKDIKVNDNMPSDNTTITSKSTSRSSIDVADHDQINSKDKVKEQTIIHTGNSESEDSLNPQDISETDSVTLDTSNSQNIVQEMITIRIEDSPQIVPDNLNSSIEDLKKNISLENEEEEMTATKLNLRIKAKINLHKKELEIQEKKYQHQIDGLTIKLSAKQQEVLDLVEQMQDVKESTQNDDSKQQLEIKVEEMKRLVREKEAVAESIRIDLQYTKNEFEFSKTKMKKLEEDLGKAQETIASLQEQNTSITNELKRSKDLEGEVKKLKEELKKTESVKKDLQNTLSEIEVERDEEMKIVQDALDEAAQEREDLMNTFEKELKTLNTTNSAREQQMLDDFEWKLRETERGHKKKVDEREKETQGRLDAARVSVETELSESLSKVAEDRKVAEEKFAENLMQRTKRQEEIEAREKLDKMKCDLNAQWETKLRSECSRLRGELDELHTEEKRSSQESLKVQKEQEIQTIKKSFETRQNEINDEISRLKTSIKDKDSQHRVDIDNQRTSTDRTIWDLRMKLQKITISSFDLKQQLEEKHKEEMERLRCDQMERFRELELRLERYDNEAGVDVVGPLVKKHKIQMDHVGEQHQISMERYREELESEKFQAVEEARVIITQHHEYIEANLKEKIGDLQKTYSQGIEELENVRQNLSRKEETIRNLEEELERKRDCFSSSNCSLGSNNPPVASSTSSGFSSQFSLASSNDTDGSRNSQDRYCNSEGILENSEDPQKPGNGGLLGKVFGGGWFTPSKSNNRRGSTPISNKKSYSNS